MFTNCFAKNLFIVLMVAAALASVSFAAFSYKALPADRSASTEQIRGSSLGPSYTLDLSDAQVEKVRTSRTVDNSWNPVEKLRVGRSADAADRSYDGIESLRIERIYKGSHPLVYHSTSR